MVDPVPCWRVTLMSADPLHSHPMARVAIKNKSLVDQKTPWVYVIDLSLENSGQEVFNLVASLRGAPTRQRLSLEHLPEEVTYTDAPLVFQSVVPAERPCESFGRPVAELRSVYWIWHTRIGGGRGGQRC